jgi:predicted dehydrogenase
MKNEKVVVGFIGSGSIARSHAYSLNSLRYFYNDIPVIELNTICSSTEVSRMSFAKQFGFIKSCDLEDFVRDNRINTVFILSPNKVHFKHLKKVIGMTGLKRIYLEKPVCSDPEEEKKIANLIQKHQEIKIQVGFQFLFSATIMEMLKLWKSGILGNPLHFDLKYYHGDYLQREYRDNRRSRLTSAPDGGAMADLGSHSLSMLIAFLGDRLRITGALQGGHFPDVIEDSDLFSLISVYDEASGAVGTISASRISSGTGDYFCVELYAQEGAIWYSSRSPDYFEFYKEESGVRNRIMVGSNFKPLSSFPSAHVPPGWLRSMIHAHRVFLKGNDNREFVPDIKHGLDVQRFVSQTAEHLRTFRESLQKI